MRRVRAAVLALVVTAAVLGLAGPVVGPVPAAQAGTARLPGRCTEVSRPLSVGVQALRITVAGTLCLPPGGARAVDVLVHGGTYNRSYWDWPVSPATYSYVARTLAAGRATFSYDRIGVGATTRPPSARVTLGADASQLHELVQWLRGSFDEVTVVGHSLGSVVAVEEAGRYRDVDRLVVTGLLHTVRQAAANLPTAFQPAQLDPLFADLRLTDLGYLTTRPGRRAPLFYAPGADPAVIAWDETHKDLMSGTEVGQVLEALTLPAGTGAASAVTAPVLLVVGELDAAFCGAEVDCRRPGEVLSYESRYYPHAAGITAEVVPGTGHDVQLHPSAGASFTLVDAWIRTH